MIDKHFLDDVKRRYIEKLADIKTELMPVEDWVTASIEEKNRHLDGLAEGDYQLFSKNGKPLGRFAHGNESDVFHGLGSTRKFPKITKEHPYGNVVIKKPLDTSKLDFLEAFRREMLGDTIFDTIRGYKKDIQENTKNHLWLPISDFEGAGENNIASEWMTELNSSDLDFKSRKFRKAIRLLNSRLKKGNPGEKLNPEIVQVIKDNCGEILDLPMIRGKSGNPYWLSDVTLSRDTVSNLGKTIKKELKPLDYIPHLIKKIS